VTLPSFLRCWQLTPLPQVTNLAKKPAIDVSAHALFSDRFLLRCPTTLLFDYKTKLSAPSNESSFGLYSGAQYFRFIGVDLRVMSEPDLNSLPWKSVRREHVLRSALRFRTPRVRCRCVTPSPKAPKFKTQRHSLMPSLRPRLSSFKYLWYFLPCANTLGNRSALRSTSGAPSGPRRCSRCAQWRWSQAGA
jgi:hypothetical protein